MEIEQFEFLAERIRAIDVTAERLADLDAFLFRGITGQVAIDRRHVDLLRRHTDDPSPALRSAALLALGRLGERDVTPAIVDTLATSTSYDVRQQCTEVIRAVLLPEIQQRGSLAGTAEVERILSECRRHAAEAPGGTLPDGPPVMSQVAIHGDYAWARFGWPDRGSEFLLRRNGRSWQVVALVGSWVA